MKMLIKFIIEIPLINLKSRPLFYSKEDGSIIKQLAIFNYLINNIFLVMSAFSPFN